MKTKASRLHAQVRSGIRIEPPAARPSETEAAAPSGCFAAEPEASGARQKLLDLFGKQTMPLATRTWLHAVATGWGWLVAKRRSQVAGKRLRVVETVSLGEKRFAAVLHVDGAQFLIGGGANNVSLLASLHASAGQQRFAQVLQQQAEEPGL